MSPDTGAPKAARPMTLETRLKIGDTEYVQPIKGGRWARFTPIGSRHFVPGWEGEVIEEVVRLREEAGILRFLLWLRHGHDGLYGDDGEMQCSRCPVDFKRESPAAINALFIRQGEDQLARRQLDPEARS